MLILVHIHYRKVHSFSLIEDTRLVVRVYQYHLGSDTQVELQYRTLTPNFSLWTTKPTKSWFRLTQLLNTLVLDDRVWEWGYQQDKLQIQKLSCRSSTLVKKLNICYWKLINEWVWLESQKCTGWLLILYTKPHYMWSDLQALPLLFCSGTAWEGDYFKWTPEKIIHKLMGSSTSSIVGFKVLFQLQYLSIQKHVYLNCRNHSWYS